MAFYKKFSPEKKGNKPDGFAQRRGGQFRYDHTDKRELDRNETQNSDSRAIKRNTGYYSSNKQDDERNYHSKGHGENRGRREYQKKDESMTLSTRGPRFKKSVESHFSQEGMIENRRHYKRSSTPASNRPLMSSPQSSKPTESFTTSITNEVPENLLSGRNPIREAIKTGRDIEKLMVAEGDLSGSAREIVSMAKKSGIIIQTVERSRLDQITRNHQGMIAFASAFTYANVEDILNTAKEKKEQPFIVILDKITDPMNLGAIIRSAACVGVHGVIVQQHRAVGLTPSAVRASAGAVEHVKVARVTNINQTIRMLKGLGLWVYAADPKGEDYRKVNFSGACALVIGSEGEGISQLTLNLCDQAVSIPMSGVIDSLNASVAAGILMYGVYSGRA